MWALHASGAPIFVYEILSTIGEREHTGGLGDDFFQRDLESDLPLPDPRWPGQRKAETRRQTRREQEKRIERRRQRRRPRREKEIYWILKHMSRDNTYNAPANVARVAHASAKAERGRTFDRSDWFTFASPTRARAGFQSIH
ncbi:hypothetical protein EVAR_53502_1 [Eumeta japonica]|uniref:Uncharacterized protein n=1 Tax=Eumeta variegata TaxID=151549 RepID=A0A4C1Y4K1_EUMVA|nr:hypothetical protein EVAR_53502_1 [Eumeta japonica]